MPSIETALSQLRGMEEPRDGYGSNPFRFASKLSAPATPAEILSAWPAALPQEVVDLWTTTSEGWLFEDVEYGQWGLHILSPSEAAARTESEQTARPEDHADGDVVLGEFLGDSELLVVTSAGHVLISLLLDPRADWPTAAASVTEFLTKYAEAAGDKYWD